MIKSLIQLLLKGVSTNLPPPSPDTYYIDYEMPPAAQDGDILERISVKEWRNRNEMLR